MYKKFILYFAYLHIPINVVQIHGSFVSNLIHCCIEYIYTQFEPKRLGSWIGSYKFLYKHTIVNVSVFN